MPDSYRANGGFRTDLTQAAAALHPAVIRWPGGSFIGDYRWKDGIGPQSKRNGKNGWDEWDPLSFGIDEFITFTRKMGAEPVIVVWTGPRSKMDRATYFRTRWISWSTAMGRRDSPWGKVRAQNGHPEPYRVRYWEIDNESGEMSAADYVSVLRTVCARDEEDGSHIRIIAGRSTLAGGRYCGDPRCGSTGGLLEHPSIRSPRPLRRRSRSRREVLEVARGRDRKIAESETETFRFGVECAEHRLADGALCRWVAQRNGARRQRSEWQLRRCGCVTCRRPRGTTR